MKNIYQNGTYLTNNPNWHAEDSPWKVKNIIQIFDNNGIHPSTVCEVGCGAGNILLGLSETLPEETIFKGYEISPDVFQLCREKETKNITFQHSDINQDEGGWDVVLSMDVFEHVEDYFGFLKILKEKGRYKLFHIPLDISVQSVLRNSPIINQRETVGHIHYFTKETALATLTDCGYRIIDHFYTGSSIEVPNQSLRSRMFSLPRRIAFNLHQDYAVRLLGGYSLMVLAE